MNANASKWWDCKLTVGTCVSSFVKRQGGILLALHQVGSCRY